MGESMVLPGSLTARADQKGTLGHADAIAPRTGNYGGDGEDIFPVRFANAQKLVFRLAFRITRNEQDSEDAQQEALLKAYRNLGQFQGRARFTTWLSSIAINEALMSRRKQRNVLQIEYEDYVAQAEQDTTCLNWNSNLENAEQEYLRKEFGAMLTSAVAKLSPPNREVFVLRAIQDFNTNETAELLNISVSAVKTRMRRARLQLQKFLKHTRERHSSQSRVA
jgi:RNA polymerase sigma-70 factor (ECF subfamily)